MILVNNAGSGHVFTPLEHADWNGWTFTDLVFPFFLWMAGLAMTLSFARRVEQGADRRVLLLHALRRAALIFLLGLCIAAYPYFPLTTIRIPGVLQRIAVCYFAAVYIFLYTRWRGQVAAILVLLTTYWLLMAFYPVPGYGAGNLDPIGNFAQYIDSMFLSGHMYSATKVWDPEGIVSTLPAIATVLFGVLCGHWMRQDRGAAERTAWMMATAALLLALGGAMDLALPINKKLWTSSYAVFMAGMAQMTFACFYWVLDVQQRQRWAKPLVIYGMNAITVYALSGLIAKTLSLTGVRTPIWNNVFAHFGPPKIASLSWAIAYVLLLYIFAYLLYRKKWFLRF